MFVEFFDETEYLPAMDPNACARPHCVQVKHLLRNQQTGALHVQLVFAPQTHANVQKSAFVLVRGARLRYANYLITS